MVTDACGVDGGRDPVGDLGRLVAELSGLGLYASRSTYVAYFLTFDRPNAVDQARSHAIAEGWSAAIYPDGTTLVMRLSRQGPLTGRRLREDRDRVHALALRFHARWQGLAVEDLDQRERWQEIAERQSGRAPEATGPAAAARPAGVRAGDREEDDRATA